jgi:hypothetical protein
MMSPWQVALRWAAYLVILALGLRWLSAAAPSLQELLIAGEDYFIDNATTSLGALLGLKGQGICWLTALLMSVKPVVGVYLLLTALIAAWSQLVCGRVDPARLDASLLLALAAVMLTAAPGLIVLRMMPGTIDDLTVVVVGITFAALSKPEFLSEQPATQPETATG